MQGSTCSLWTFQSQRSTQVSLESLAIVGGKGSQAPKLFVQDICVSSPDQRGINLYLLHCLSPMGHLL